MNVLGGMTIKRYKKMEVLLVILHSAMMIMLIQTTMGVLTRVMLRVPDLNFVQCLFLVIGTYIFSSYFGFLVTTTRLHRFSTACQRPKNHSPPPPLSCCPLLMRQHRHERALQRKAP